MCIYKFMCAYPIFRVKYPYLSSSFGILGYSTLYSLTIGFNTERQSNSILNQMKNAFLGHPESLNMDITAQIESFQNYNFFTCLYFYY